MKRIVLRQAAEEAGFWISRNRPIFYTPECLLLAFIGDYDLGVLLRSVSIDVDKLAEMTNEYLNSLPRFQGKAQQPILSDGLERISVRLKAKVLGRRGSPPDITAVHFLEAYAYEGLKKEGPTVPTYFKTPDAYTRLQEFEEVPPCSIADLMAERHSTIEPAVYD